MQMSRCVGGKSLCVRAQVQREQGKPASVFATLLISLHLLA